MHNLTDLFISTLFHHNSIRLHYTGWLFTLGLPLKVLSTEKLILARLGVSRTIYVNVHSPNLGFPYFNFLGEAQWKKSPCNCITHKFILYWQFLGTGCLSTISVPESDVKWGRLALRPHLLCELEDFPLVKLDKVSKVANKIFTRWCPLSSWPLHSMSHVSLKWVR